MILWGSGLPVQYALNCQSSKSDESFLPEGYIISSTLTHPHGSHVYCWGDDFLTHASVLLLFRVAVRTDADTETWLADAADSIFWLADTAALSWLWLADTVGSTSWLAVTSEFWLADELLFSVLWLAVVWYWCMCIDNCCLWRHLQIRVKTADNFSILFETHPVKQKS